MTERTSRAVVMPPYSWRLREPLRFFGHEFQDSPVAEYACASRLRQGGSVAYPACLVSPHFHGGF